MLENRPKISLEMEKLNRIYDPLLPLVDVIFVSKEYALSKNFKNKVWSIKKDTKENPWLLMVNDSEIISFFHLHISLLCGSWDI